MVDYSSLENYRTERYRGFESLSFRKESNELFLWTLFVSKANDHGASNQNIDHFSDGEGLINGQNISPSYISQEAEKATPKSFFMPEIRDKPSPGG